MIYLDNASTTKMLGSTKRIYLDSIDDFFNPSSSYSKGIIENKKIVKARSILSKALNCEDSEVFYTSSATEANNIIIKGSLRSSKKDEFIFSSGEHSSVYQISRQLAGMGYKIHYINLDRDGTINLNHLKTLVNDNTRLVSVIHVSNETGAVNDIRKASGIIKSINSNTIFHSDGVQAFLKIKSNVMNLNVDAYTVSGHKCYSPKGIAAVYINKNIKLTPLLVGGGQESGIRPGTENTPSIVAFSNTIKTLINAMDKNKLMIKKLNDLVCFAFEKDNDIIINKSLEYPYILNMIINGVKSELLINMLDMENIYVGSGSSCSNNRTNNRVLSGMGYNKNDQKNSIRISFGIYNNKKEIVEFIKILKEKIIEIRKLYDIGKQ